MYVSTRRPRRGTRGLGQILGPDWMWTAINRLPELAPNPAPIWSEQAYIPGAVNADPSVNTNPNPTVAGTIKDLTMVWNDPLAENPVYNATDTPETSGATPSALGSIPAWLLLIPVGVFAAWVALK